MPTCHSNKDFQGRKFIFVHVPKTAGVSITSALSGHVEPYESDLELRCSILDRSYDLVGRYQGVLFWHITVGDLRAHYGDPEIDSHFSFAFIRNPWEWLVSMYSFIREHKAHPESMICGHMTFKQFLRYFAAKKVTQHTFFSIGGSIAVTKVFRLEDLPNALEEIASQTRLKLQDIPIENVSEHRDYWEYYDRDDIDLVRIAFADDVALGGYDFQGVIRISYAGGAERVKRFILDGTPRSGTTALMGALTLHQACFCANERFQIFADHDKCLFPERLADIRVPPAFPEENGLIEVNVDAYLARKLKDPSEAYPYLQDVAQCKRLQQRKLSVFGNKTPRYYFNALDICAKNDVSWVVIIRDPVAIASSWNSRATNAGDTWSPDDAGLLGMMEYLQLCHVLTQAPEKKTFVVLYEHIFFARWRSSLKKLLGFLGLTADAQYLEDFGKYFVRKKRKGGKRKLRPFSNEGEALFYEVSCVGDLYGVFVGSAAGGLSSVRGKLQSVMQMVNKNLDSIVRQYFESCIHYANPGALLTRILSDQSLYFARARFQSFLDPLAVGVNSPHLSAWLSVVLFQRRAFAASRHFSGALKENSFSEQVKTSFSDCTIDMPYIWSVLEARGLSKVFEAGFKALDPLAIHKSALCLEEAGLLEDAQILRYRAISLACNDAEYRAAASSFGEGEAKVDARIGNGAGTWSSYLDMDGVRSGFP